MNLKQPNLRILRCSLRRLIKANGGRTGWSQIEICRNLEVLELLGFEAFCSLNLQSVSYEAL